MIRALYSFAWWLALPLVLGRLWWRGRKEHGYREHWGERLGFYPQAQSDAMAIWVHAVSVGETRASEPLVDALLQAYPNGRIVMTHMTPTGRATGQALFAKHGERLVQAYIPYDIGVIVARFLRHFAPRICILMETEVWPNLIAQCAAHKVPVALVNARLSERSLRRGRKFGGLAFEPSVSLPGVRVIQGIGTKHDRFHTDYSQTCVLAADACVYQGAPASLSTLLQDPIASSLISVEGPLQITRQPGVPQLDPIGPVSAGVLIERAQVAALPNDPLAREPILLGWVEQGLAEYAWSEITVGDLTFYVFSDALMFGGVRISVSATLQQQIADRLGCVLLTPRMADLVFQNASQVILPYPLPAGPTMASTAYMLNESDKITKAAGG